MVRIVNAFEMDIPLIQAIADKTWWATYSEILTAEQLRYMLDAIYSTDALSKVMKTGTQKFLILYDEKGPQGFASYGLRSEDEKICKLHKLYVLPENHGKGYGKMLVEEVKKLLIDREINTLDLNVNRHNPALSFYEKIGFRIIKEEDVPIGPYWMNDYVMRMEFKE